MKYDSIILGGGHNGLVTAAYLAKSGQKVCVLEKRHILGGCSSTEELWPGYKISPAAYVISLFLPEIMEDLRLVENGLKILPRNPSSFTPDLNGPGLLLSGDQEQNHKEISFYSAPDADAYAKYEEELTNLAEVIEPMAMQAPPDIMAKGVFKKIKAGIQALNMLRKFGRLGDKIPEAIEVLTGDAATILNRWFKSDVLKASLAGDAIIGSFTSPSNPGSSYILLHHVMGEAGGQRGIWGYIEGGMGGLADALEKTCKDLGVDILLNHEVTAIDVEKGRAVGVGVKDAGERMIPRTLSAKNIISSVDATTTMRWANPENFPESYVRRVNNIDYSSASAKVNMAIKGLPKFAGMERRESREGCYNGTIHISPDLKYIEQAYHDARMGRFSRRPVLEITTPSVVDPTLAPEGHHVMQMFVQYAPYHLDGMSWDDDDVKRAFYNTCIDTLEEYAPDIRERILHHHVLTPLDIERTYGMTGGNIFQGSMIPHQMGPFRSKYKTPLKGLYLCGAATSPGGGVVGACGKNAAEAILS